MSDARLDTFATRQIAAVLAAGVVGVLVVGLQPQLLGALAVEGRLSVAALGDVATAELLAMGIAAGGAGAVLSIERLRLWAAAALGALAALDALTAWCDPGLILPLRAAAGLAEGVLVWLTIGLIVRTAQAARWSALYLMVQTAAQLALATLLGLWLIPATGSFGGFVAMAAIAALALAIVPAMPRRFAALPAPAGAATRIATRGWIALASVAAWLAFVVAVWVYVEPLGLQRGLSHAQVAVVAPLSLALQIAGAGAAMMLSGRLPALPVLGGCAAANAALLVAFATPGSASAYVAATAAFGFLWLFAMPFQLPIVIAADPTRRAAELIGGAQLTGASLGPLLAARLVAGDDVDGVLWFGGAALAAALALTLAAAHRRGGLAIR